MIIYLVRHGQTNLNKEELMQGLTDEPLNETGLEQARIMRKMIGDMTFDAVYASPLYRSQQTAEIVGNVSRSEIIIDKRIIETDFGKYEKKKYAGCGPKMSLYWTLPEIFPAPEGVETVKSMVSRAQDFLKELEQKDYEKVLVVAHGGILRSLNGYLLDKRNGIKWRPKMQNCEVRIYESVQGKHKLIDILKAKQ